MIRFAAAAALIALSQAAAAQTGACLTRQEVRGLFAFTAPSLVEAAAKKCAPVLSADAFLRTGAPAMVERLHAEGMAQGGSITGALEKIAGKQLPEGLSEETVRSLVRDMIGAELTKDMNPKDCGLVNELVSSLSPLPSANLATMIAAILELGGSKGKTPFRICES